MREERDPADLQRHVDKDTKDMAIDLLRRAIGAERPCIELPVDDGCAVLCDVLFAKIDAGYVIGVPTANYAVLLA